ncbi:MAG: hypothetical protein ACLFVU_02215 [Phycisphaerae bacterium]
MKALKDHLFLLVMVGIVLVAAGLSYVLSVGDKVESRLEAREKASRELESHLRNPISEEKVSSEENYIESLKTRARTVKENNLDFSRASFDVLELPLYSGDSAEGNVDAFPIDPALYQRYALYYQFGQKYRQALQETLDSLDPTSPPAPAAIEARAQALEDQKLLDYRRKTGREAGDVRDRPDRNGGPSRRMDDEEDWARRNLREDRENGSGRTDVNVAEQIRAEAAREARLSLMKGKAQDGKIFASMAALQQAFEAPTTTDEDIWMAQLNLWVVQDIILAIQSANNAVAITLPKDKKANVINLPVKRLVGIEVESDYWFGAGGSGASSAEDGMFEDGPRRGRGRPNASTADLPTPQSLTQRRTSEDYEIIRYTFTVDIDSTKLFELQNSLLQETFHTITNIRYEEIPPTQRQLMYYGSSPVLRVTYTGELLMLADWTRGQLNPERDSRTRRRSDSAEQKEWNIEPLMPTAVLRNRLSKVLRPADRKRLGR